MQSYIKKTIIVIIVNILLCIVFVYASYDQWQIFQVDNQTTFVASDWGPFVRHYYIYLINGHIDFAPTVEFLPNWPFLLFFASTIVNIYLFVYFLRHEKEHYNKENLPSS